MFVSLKVWVFALDESGTNGAKCCRKLSSGGKRKCAQVLYELCGLPLEMQGCWILLEPALM